MAMATDAVPASQTSSQESRQELYAMRAGFARGLLDCKWHSPAEGKLHQMSA